MYVLIVDDNPDIQEMLTVMLESHRMPTRVASDGREGLKHVKREQPAAVILDLVMPGMDGFRFLAKLERMGLADAFPVIVLSAVVGQAGTATLRGTFTALKKGHIEIETLIQTLRDAGISLERNEAA